MSWCQLIMSASYLQGQSYYNESTMDNWSQLEGTRFLPFRIYLCLLPRHLSPKMYGFLSVQRLLLSFVCPRTPTVYHLHDFLPPGPTPISLLIPSHLPAGKYPLPFSSFASLTTARETSLFLRAYMTGSSTSL